MGGLKSGGLAAQIAGTVLVVVGSVLSATGVGSPAGIPLTAIGMVMIVGGSVAVALDPPEAPEGPGNEKPSPGFQGLGNKVGGDAVIPAVYGECKVRPVFAQAFITPLDKHNDAITEEPGSVASKKQGLSLQCIVSEGPIESIDSVEINGQRLWEDVEGETFGVGDGSTKTFKLPRRYIDAEGLKLYVDGVQKTSIVGQSVTMLQIGTGTGTRKNFEHKHDDKTAVIDMDTVVVYENGQAAYRDYTVVGLNDRKFKVKFEAPGPSSGNKIQVSYDYAAADAPGDVKLTRKKGQTTVRFTTAPSASAPLTYTGKVWNYPDVTFEPFLGGVNQPPIEGSNQVRNSYEVGDELLKSQPVTFTTKVDVDDVSVAIGALQGLIHYFPSGATGDVSAKVSVDYRLSGATNWISLINPVTEGGDVTNPIGANEFRLRGETAVAKRWEISIRETLKRSVALGRMPKSALEDFVRGTYEVRVTRTNDVRAPDRTYYRDRTWFTHATEVQEETLSYPGVAGFWLHAVASARLQGSLPEVSCIAKGRKVKNLSTGVTAYSRNPAWCVADLLTNTRFGGGVSESDLTTASWTAWGAWCDELVTLHDKTTETRCLTDVVVDYARPPMQWVKDLMAPHYAIPVMDGKKWGLFVDKAASSVKTYEYTGAAANQELNSLSVSVESLSKTPTEIEVTYIDRDAEYERETLLIVPETRATERTKRGLLLPGVTRRTQAIRVGNHLLRSSQEQPMLVEFIAMPDGALSEVGDVVTVKSDVGDWSTGKLFRVLRVGFDSKLRVRLLCREYDANLYAASSSELPVSKAVVVNTKPTAQAAAKAGSVTQSTARDLPSGTKYLTTPKKSVVLKKKPTLRIEEPTGGVA